MATTIAARFAGARRGSAWKASALVLGLGAAALSACTSDVDTGGTGAAGGSGGSGGSGGAGGGGPVTTADKVDILLAIDNSRSMADKQEILALALTDLVQALVNPPCLDAGGNLVSPQPAGPADACPDGSSREYAPVNDIHLGIISSSIGGHGSDACQASQPGTETNDDRGHLLARLDPSGGAAPTYDNKGFLAWDPSAKYNPPGESDPVALGDTFRDMVLGVGQIGCGYESQLESWYRFLVDPEPYDSLAVVNGSVVAQGVDAVLLQQRADFLRPDSMLAILMLTDENDCSTRETGQFFYANQLTNANATPFHLPAPRSECATNPNDACCKSCGQASGSCPEDPSCKNPDGTIKMLDAAADPINLRCFDQKRRFGIDFMYPIDRYTLALTSSTVANRAGELVPNPVFSDLNPSDAYSDIRDPGLVVLAGIVGVPWQDIARDPANLALGFKSAAQLSEAGAWDVILGQPEQYVAPQDPLMIESIAPRPGVQAGNAINGGERTIQGQDDLQYACIFPLLSPRDCSVPTVACDCQPGSDSPLCAPNPNDGGQTTLQVAAKAYPGLRELSVLKGIGDQGVTASICPAQANDPAAGDFAYRPAIRALLERMATRL